MKPTKKIRISCVQTNAGENFEKNLKFAIHAAWEAHHEGAQIIAYPEMFLYRGPASRYSEIAEKMNQAIHKFQHMACMSRVPILLGSILEKSEKKNRYYNTSLLISNHGRIIAAYRKIHLFDVETPGKTKVKESKFFLAGKRIVSASLLDVHFGLSICFDLRFPDLYQKLRKKGAQVLFVPSNFLKETGQAHWHSLLRARAIENQAYVVAPAQVGHHSGILKSSYGHSLVINPWGEILAEAKGEKAQIITANLDFSAQERIRKRFPIMKS